MKKSSFLAFILVITFPIIILGQTKKPLSHSDSDHWNDLANPLISDQGSLVSYEVNPQEGDGKLWLYIAKTVEYMDFQRGYDARISADESMMAFKIKPQADTVRKAKLAKVKKEKLPKDSLGIFLVGQDSTIKFPAMKSFKIPEGGPAWLAWLQEETDKPKDTTAVDTTFLKGDGERKKKDKKKEEGNTLVVYHPASGEQASFEDVTDYTFSKNGKLLVFISIKTDSIDSVFVKYMVYPGIQARTIFAGPGYAKTSACDEAGGQVAWLYSADTAKTRVYDLYLWSLNKNKYLKAVDTTAGVMPEGWCVSVNGKLFFSENGRRLFFGTAVIPEAEQKDTLTEDEKVSVDIWNWKDDRLQPQQLKEKDDDLKRAYDAVYHIPVGRMVQLGDENLERLAMDRKHNGPYALGYDRKPYMKEISWDADSKQDIYLINLDNGSREKILEAWQSSAYLSPLGRYVAYYNELDSSWNSFSVKSGTHHKLTADIPVCFAQEEFDMPTTPGPYGMKGWTKNEDHMMVYDRYDLWMLDPEGKAEPQKLTDGRDSKLQYRYIDLDPEMEYIPEDIPVLVRSFDETSKDFFFYDLDLKRKEQLAKLYGGPYRFLIPKKAKESDELIWQRMSFSEYPDLWISERDFSDARKLSDANPQQGDYNWGTAELVHWTSADGVDLDGLLYKPEDFDPDSTYPMIVYFYEKYSDALHAHYVPKPSRSTVNFTYYASNGYLVFVPDIVYKTGFPGQSAYNSIVSGTLKLMENSWVDKDHIGIQGQSWGGYQVAYLVTQTNMFAAAMAGAPVSNMTSAYGGIRWGSGMSRMFQYEGSQSRIGGTLWEKPWRYIENSPIFFADKVETPLLMMHNDDDGAVPWYQGIEYFVALRRLNKPVWMLTYNGAPHNLKRRADMKDLTIRMQQFFDHYLKGAPAPVWMEEGIPAVKKGKEMGLELEK